MPFQISSVLVAAEAISNWSVSPRLATRSFRMNSAMGERQMLPKQMKRTFIMVLFTPFCLKMPCFARGFRCFIKYSKITDSGKSVQNLASCYYLLVVTRKGLLLRIFLFLLHLRKYFIPFFLITPLIIF